MQMQTMDAFSVNRRTPDLEDYLEILRRHKAWIIGPAFLGLVLSVVVAFLWPDTFQSTAVIRVVPPQIPEYYVRANTNAEMAQRINSMAQSILSRATLTSIIQANGLYPRDVKRLPMEDVIENMRKAIRIGDVRSLQSQGERQRTAAFSISFSYENRILAQRVTQDLVGRFINENTRERSTTSILTTEFLNDQLESARKDLESIESRLVAFRLQNAGRLPDERDINMQTLRHLENRAGNLNATISRLNQDKMLLENQLRILQDRYDAVKRSSEAVAGGLTAQARNEKLDRLERDIASMEQALSSLREQYTEAHPDIRRLRQQIALYKRQRDELVKEEEERQKNARPEPELKRPAVFNRELKDLEGGISNLQSQIRLKDIQVEEASAELKALDSDMKDYQGRIKSSPLSEQQYRELVRDYDLAKQKYHELNAKKAQSAIATDLENRKQGETLELLDAASLPQTPTEPKRWMIILGGLGAGLVAGVMMAGAREMKDTTLKNLKDVRAYTQLTVLGCIPLLENDLVVRRRRRLSWLAWSTAILVGILVMSGSILFYYTTKV